MFEEKTSTSFERAPSKCGYLSLTAVKLVLLMYMRDKRIASGDWNALNLDFLFTDVGYGIRMHIPIMTKADYLYKYITGVL